MIGQTNKQTNRNYNFKYIVYKYNGLILDNTNVIPISCPVQQYKRIRKIPQEIKYLLPLGNKTFIKIQLFEFKFVVDLRYF